MRRAEPLAGLGGILLIVAVLANGGFGFFDVVLLILGLLALAVPITSLAARGPARPVAIAVLGVALGWIAVLITAIRVLGDPETADWLALAGALLAWIGAYLSLRDESTPGAAAPEIPRRPAP